MEPVFLPRASIYRGDYSCILRNPDCEFEADIHYHDFYEVQFYLAGEGQIDLGGKQHTLRQGDVLLVNMFQPHVLHTKKGYYYERFCIDLDPSFLLAACTENSNLLELFSSDNPNYPIYHLDVEQLTKYLSLFLKYGKIQLGSGWDIMERAILYEVLANLYFDLCRDGTVAKMDSRPVVIIANLVRYISDHISEDLSLDKLAAEVNYSTCYLCRIFKKYAGCTLTKYITSKRIEYVKTLLKDNIPSSEASERAGFNNYSYFFKTFKKATGISPTEYQAQFRQNTADDATQEPDQTEEPLKEQAKQTKEDE